VRTLAVALYFQPRLHTLRLVPHCLRHRRTTDLETQSGELVRIVSASILYLHGFRSSPDSVKAHLLADALKAREMGDRLFCPALSHVPSKAIEQAEAIIRAQPGPLTLIGSSLGGFYATHLAERHKLRAALINPLVALPLPNGQFVGEHVNLHTGERFDFTADHVGQLVAMKVPQVTPENYLLLLETGDEVLDYRQALAHYADCRQMVFAGGSHSFTHFAELLPQLLEYCGL
jgi:uncharacterized protein